MPPAPSGGYGTSGGYGPYNGQASYSRYGPYSGHRGHEPPPAPEPGLVPLRPLAFGEILDGAATAIRWNPKSILTPSAIIATIWGVVVGLVTYIVERNMAADASAIVPITDLFASLLLNTILTGLLAVTIGQGVLGRKESLGSAWVAARSRIGALFAMVLLLTVFLGLGSALAAALSAGAGLLLWLATHLPVAGVFVSVLGGIATVIFTVLIGNRWILSVPVVMLERASPMASLGRSWRLVQRSSWRVLGIMLATDFIAVIANVLVSLPFWLLGGFTQAHVFVIGLTILIVGEIVAATVTTPLVAGVTVLLYTDLRMRREGMDIVLRAAAAGQAPGGASTGGQGHGPW